MYNFAKASSAEYRALGIVTALGPQIDLATEPRWLRVGGTFGENTKLSTDMAQAYVDGSQSTYVNGEDQGWGKDSINCMIKHFPGDGAGEGGRESHTRAGKYAAVSYTHLRAHETGRNLVCRLLLEKKNNCLLYTSPSPRERQKYRMPSSA